MDQEHITHDTNRGQAMGELERIRKRPGMYVGSTGVRGLHEMVFTVAGQAVNEALAGRARAVGVFLTPEGGVRVVVDRPGAPGDAAGDAEGPDLEALLTRMPSGTAPAGRRAAAVSLVGIGPELLTANALSSRLTAEVRGGGVRQVLEYARGVAVTPRTTAGPAADSGTTIIFRPDAGVFDDTAACSFAALAERFRELAFLNRSLDISLTDERPPGGSRSVRYLYPGGARDFVALLDAGAGAPVHPDVIGFEREDPGMAGTVEVAMRWSSSPVNRILGFANSRPTPFYGGTHMEGFRRGSVAAINTYARQRGLLTAADPDLGAERIEEGLTAVVSVKLDHPEYFGSTRGGLGNTEVLECVGRAVREHLGSWLEEHPEQAAAVLGRMLGQARTG